MKFNIQTLRESLNHPKSGKKVFTEGKKQNVILSEEQLDRLLLQLNESREKFLNRTIKDAHKLIREAIKNENLDLSVSNYSGTLIKEWYSKDEEDGATYTKDGEDGGTYNKDAKKGSTYDLGEQGMYDRNPGLAAAEGLENVINGIKKAYDMIKDSDTRKRLANSMTKLGNFMTITADAMAAGRDQRGMRDPNSLRDALPYPELETVTVDDEEEISEDAKPDFLDLDKDGNTKESMKKAAKDKEVKEVNVIDVSDADGIELITRDEDETLEESEKEKEKLIQEDIKKMKQIIKPITKI